MEKNMKEYMYVCSLTGGSDSKESACSVRDPVQFLGCVTLTLKKAEHDELMLLNYGTDEDSWESFGQQGNQTSQS